MCLTSSLHHQLGIIDQSSVPLLHMRKVPAHIRNLVKGLDICREQDLKLSSSRKICQKCVDGFENISNNDLDESSCQTESVHILHENDIMTFIENLPEQLRVMLVYNLGRFDFSVCREAAKLSSAQRKLDDLIKLNPSNQRNDGTLLDHYLRGLKQESDLKLRHRVRTDTASDYEFCKAKEACLSLVAPIKILPYHFREVLMLYSLSQSKTVVNLLATGSPVGNYKTVRSWLRSDNSAEYNNQFCDYSQKDVMAVFDNNQKLLRRWTITLNNSVKCSVITMLAFIEMQQSPGIMFEKQNSPEEWMWWNIPANAIELMKTKESTSKSFVFYNHTLPWLGKLLEEVIQEQKWDEGMIIDGIDGAVKEDKRRGLFKTCPHCGDTEMPIRNRLCRVCNKLSSTADAKTEEIPCVVPKKSQLNKPKETRVKVHAAKGTNKHVKISYERASNSSKKSPYEAFGNHHPSEPTKIHMGSPVFKNPCSYDALVTVLRDIGRQAGVKQYGGNREWVAVMCDGLPYNLCISLIERYVQCSVCGECIHGVDNAIIHAKAEHPDHPVQEFTKEFRWCLLLPGPGHIEMNMVKAHVKIMWGVYWEDMVEIFNFKSENAKRSAYNVSDHHKGWTLTRIARDSIGRELLVL